MISPDNVEYIQYNTTLLQYVLFSQSAVSTDFEIQANVTAWH